MCDTLADHPSLQDLTLDQNDLGDIGALALSNALVTNKKLVSLSLVHCHVCEGGARRILYSLETRNKTLRALVCPVAPPIRVFSVVNDALIVCTAPPQDMSDNQLSQALHSSIHAVVRKRGASGACAIL